MMRCAKFESNKRSHLSATRGVESMPMTGDKVNKKNDSSPRSQAQSIAGYSTPVTRKQDRHVDESPDFDYSPSPILPACTQEASDEVAWDWQSSLNKTPENRTKKQSVQYETPKGTKLLHRKRNSNSPLLCKPLKRKTIKMENIENIGQFSAELQALNERIKQSSKIHTSNRVKKEEAPTLTSTREEEIIDGKRNSAGRCSDGDKQQNSVGETNDNNNSDKKESSGNYDDLFDDSVDDDMIRCTQEIEDKFNMMEKGSSQDKKEEPCTNDVSNKTSVQFNFSESCRKPLVADTLGASASNTLKTYSKLSLKRDANSSIHAATQRSKDPPKSCINNNNTLHSQVKKPCEKLSQNNSADLFNFLDDSFNDWFATCVEDNKVLLESDRSLARKNDCTKSQASYKRLTNAPLKSETKSIDSFKPMTKPEISSKLLENRKFFKTKSLSDQYVNRDAGITAKGTRNVSCYAPRPTQHPNSSRGLIPHTSVARASVSTQSIVTNGCKAVNNAIPLMRGADRVHGSDVNRYAVKSDGDRFIKHHSTGNIRNKIRETAKTGSQPTAQCTAEEIEKKRLQALARLEARKKLHFMKIMNSINR